MWHRLLILALLLLVPATVLAQAKARPKRDVEPPSRPWPITSTARTPSGRSSTSGRPRATSPRRWCC